MLSSQILLYHFFKILLRKAATSIALQNNSLKFFLNLGVDSTQLVYSNPIKEESDLDWAEANNVKLTTADTIE